ncbi:MAG: hypothetical protein P8125_03095 [Gemmatimonadota bacterium]
MTSPENRRERYEIIARLGEAERRIAELQDGWTRFREKPSPARLARLRHSVTAIGRSLDRLADQLNRPEGDARKPDSQWSESPNPRHLVDAGRELDSLVQKAQQTWSRHRGRPEADSLEQISATLEGAERAADTLLEALRALDESVRSSRPPEATDDKAAASTLQQLLEEMSAAWALLRRQPSLAGTLRLKKTLRGARNEALQLARLARSGSTLADPEALRYLAGAADSVRFPPYRDRHTGAYNGRGFDVSAEAEISRCARYDRPFGLVVLSVSPEDPTTARSVIGAIRGLLRVSDLVGRTSPSEIALGLPESDGRATRRISARILRSLDAAEHGSAVRRLSYAVAPADGGNLAELLERARGRLGGHDTDGPAG